MLNVFICDDENESIARLKSALSRALPDTEMDLETFQDPKRMLSRIEKKKTVPDLLILDIVMDSLNGIDTAKQAARLAPGCQIIFLSSYNDYISDVYEAPHCYFVRKSELSQHFGKALSKALKNLSERKRVSFRENGEIRSVDAADIRYLERSLRQTRIVCGDGEFRPYSKPEELLAQADPLPFHRCHQSYWVNFLHAASLRENSVTLRDGTEIPISRSYRKTVREAWFAFLHRQYLPMEEAQE